MQIVAGSRLRVTIEDQGRGLAASARPGVGLAAMRERAELIGGQLAISPATGSSASGQGTRVSLELPLDPPRMPDASPSTPPQEQHHA